MLILSGTLALILLIAPRLTDAIRYARDVILRQARAGVMRIIICITDGRSTLESETIRVRDLFFF